MTLKWPWHAWTPQWNRYGNHIPHTSRKPSLASTWKPTSEIWMMQAYSNHHQLFLEAETKWGMQPEQKMQISQSLSSRSTENTCRKMFWEKQCPAETHSTKTPTSLQRGRILYLIKKEEEEKEEDSFFTVRFRWCIWSNLQKFHLQPFCQHTCPWCKERQACILNGRQPLWLKFNSNILV